VIARAPPTITIVEPAEAAKETTAMETMTVAATKAVTTPAHAAPTVAATAHAAAVAATTATAATDQDQRTARCTRTQLLGVAGTTRQSRQ